MVALKEQLEVVGKKKGNLCRGEEPEPGRWEARMAAL